jgi:hypothetical protein
VNDWTKNKLLKSADFEIIKKYVNSNHRVLFFNRKNIDDILYENDDSVSIDNFELNLKSLYIPFTKLNFLGNDLKNKNLIFFI